MNATETAARLWAAEQIEVRREAFVCLEMGKVPIEDGAPAAYAAHDAIDRVLALLRSQAAPVPRLQAAKAKAPRRKALRARLPEILAEVPAPGVSIRELAEMTGKTTQAVTNALRVLEKEDVVTWVLGERTGKQSTAPRLWVLVTVLDRAMAERSFSVG